MKHSEVKERNLKIVELIKEGFNDSCISKKFSICPETVRKVRLKNGLKPNFKSAKDRKIVWKEEEIKKIIDLNNKGYTRNKISELLNITESRIENLLYQLNIKSTSYKSRNKRIELNKDDIDILVGLILGDGSIRCVSKNVKTASCKIDHSIKQEEYIIHIQSKLKHVFPKINYFERSFEHFNIITPKKYLSITSPFNLDLYFLYELFYNGNTKSIPNNIKNLLTPIGVAFWFMDDGYAIPYGYSFCTDSFSKKDQLLLIKAFDENFNINVKLGKRGDTFRLKITGKEDRKKFVNLIKPFVIDSMKYKLLLMKQDKFKAVYKSRELLENPGEDNQQPSVLEIK